MLLAVDNQPFQRFQVSGMPKRVVVGVVASDKMNKTRRVEIDRLVKDPKYGKFVRRRTVCLVHDEDEASHSGDTVEIVESQPRSKQKRWELVRVVAKSREVDLAQIRADQAAAIAQQQATDEQGGQKSS